jgi:hypothetical protein
VLQVVDAANILHEFACRCAAHALRKSGVTDARSWNAIAAKRAWLRGQCSNEDLATAEHSAEYAAEVCAWYDAGGAAEVSARYAAVAAAEYSAVAAARAAAEDTARNATRAAQNRLLRIMLESELTGEDR